MSITTTDAASLAAMLQKRRPDWREQHTIANVLLQRSRENNESAADLACLLDAATDPSIRTPKGLLYVALPAPQARPGDRAARPRGPVCETCSKSRQVHDAMGLLVAAEHRHDFESEIEYRQRLATDRAKTKRAA